MLTTHDARRTTDKRRSQKLTMSTLCSGELITKIGSLASGYMQFDAPHSLKVLRL
ncbi:hypothetical protein DPMN_179565 [Dreissena polymorpha]|uniref:Uncharacterized protein n=1 Tax=Dreissena polymorpha TaxID=45954 RepID=A0A9D4EHE8_DREPO|nr:hypothetical protein DPMN_179565 [Dreissena polymorpha]